MEQVIDEPEVRVDVVSAMRHLARQGASVRQLAECVQSRLGLKPDALLQLLWYFMKAFHLSLADVFRFVNGWERQMTRGESA
jgi:hypothetical protein